MNNIELISEHDDEDTDDDTGQSHADYYYFFSVGGDGCCCYCGNLLVSEHDDEDTDDDTGQSDADSQDDPELLILLRGRLREVLYKTGSEGLIPHYFLNRL